MEFEEITEKSNVRPGEMLLYSPRNSIVVCAAVDDDNIRAFDNGRYLEDIIVNFKKIVITKKEFKKQVRSKCKGCGGGKR
tara:strand:- start:248 stop:487 length:240 start_codon:yes stop_codon:yes gene_type:complete